MAMQTVPEVDEYLVPEVAMLRALGAQAGLPGFAERLAAALRAALLALNEVPETDTMWLGTNRRPTLGKLSGYCLGRFRDDAADELARWGLVALKCHGCQEDCGLALLAPRAASGPQAALDAVSAAIWSYTHAGDVTDDQVRTVLARADRAGIERLARGGTGDEVAEVARITLRVFDGGRLSRPGEAPNR
jgi:hypothetical protein